MRQTISTRHDLDPQLLQKATEACIECIRSTLGRDYPCDYHGLIQSIEAVLPLPTYNQISYADRDIYVKHAIVAALSKSIELAGN
jgi:hypothetical protein